MKRERLFDLRQKQREIPAYLDEMPAILGLELDEFGLGGLVFLMLYLFNHQFWGLVLAVITVIFTKKLKAGKPRGYLQQWFYQRIGIELPGLLPPAKIVSFYSPAAPKEEGGDS